jgi:imidazolonepropionase-like amidohydrolase
MAVREMRAAGVAILPGTDVGVPLQVPGFSLHDELSLLVKAGLSEMEVLQAATRNPARAFNLTDQGTIETGMRADLLLLDANPLENIGNTRKIRMVVARGRHSHVREYMGWNSNDALIDCAMLGCKQAKSNARGM